MRAPATLLLLLTAGCTRMSPHPAGDGAAAVNQPQVRQGPAAPSPQTTQPRSETPPREPERPGGPWSGLPLEPVLARARSQNRPVLVFWNARWCPPCNEVKLRVLSDPRFALLTRGLLKVWADGDSPGAQETGERLGLRGYPTLLLLSPRGTKLLEVVGSVSFDRFASLLKGALASKTPLPEVIEAATRGKAEPGDWQRLAVLDWGLWARRHGLADTLRRLLALAHKAPMPTRSSLAAWILALTTEGEVPAELERRGQELVSWALRSRGANVPDVLLYELPAIWRRWVCGKPAAQQLAGTLRDLLQSVRRAPVSPADRLQAGLLLAKLPRLCRPPSAWKQVVTGPWARRLAQEAKTLLTESRSGFARKAWVGAVARVWAAIHGPEAAARLLEDHVRRSDTPWYLWSHVARLRADAGDPAGALQAARQAVRAAAGSATRIQWSAWYLERAIQWDSSGNTVAEALVLLTDKLLGTQDAWMGRNWDRSRRALERFARWVAKHPRARQAAQREAKRIAASCPPLPEPIRRRCRAAASLLSDQGPSAKGPRTPRAP